MSHLLHIPSLGTELVLAADWTFTLHRESRNSGFAEGLEIAERVSTRHTYGDNYSWTTRRTEWPKGAKTWTVTLPAGTVLKVERIYIKQGQGKFDSVTFRDTGRSHRHGRFWVKLDEANDMTVED